MESVKEFIKKKIKQFEKELKDIKLVGMKDRSRKGKFYFLRMGWTFMPQSNFKNDKIFVIERLQKEKIDPELAPKKWRKGEIEYRICYYIRGGIGKTKGSWRWGQFCPIIPAADLKK